MQPVFRKEKRGRSNGSQMRDDQCIEEQKIMTMDELKPGKNAVITAIKGEGALRLRLLDMGLIPNTKVKVRKTAPMGDPVQIVIRGYELTIRKADAAMIEISMEETGK